MKDRKNETSDLTLEFGAVYKELIPNDTGGMLLRLLVSGTKLDIQDNYVNEPGQGVVHLLGDKVTEDLLEDMARQAKEGTVPLLESHHTTLPMGWSVDSEIEDDGDGEKSLFVTFQLDMENPMVPVLIRNIQDEKYVPDCSVGLKVKRRVVWDQDAKGYVGNLVKGLFKHLALTKPGEQAYPDAQVDELLASKSVFRADTLGDVLVEVAKSVGERAVILLKEYSAENADDPSKPYGEVDYADPGYQKDKKKRYPLDTEKHIRAAWSYIHQADNRTPYTGPQLKRIESRISKAWRKKIDPDGPPSAAEDKEVTVGQKEDALKEAAVKTAEDEARKKKEAEDEDARKAKEAEEAKKAGEAEAEAKKRAEEEAEAAKKKEAEDTKKMSAAKFNRLMERHKGLVKEFKNCEDEDDKEDIAEEMEEVHSAISKALKDGILPHDEPDGDEGGPPPPPKKEEEAKKESESEAKKEGEEDAGKKKEDAVPPPPPKKEPPAPADDEDDDDAVTKSLKRQFRRLKRDSEKDHQILEEVLKEVKAIGKQEQTVNPPKRVGIPAPEGTEVSELDAAVMVLKQANLSGKEKEKISKEMALAILSGAWAKAVGLDPTKGPAVKR
jgi:hypothetical protein